MLWTSKQVVPGSNPVECNITVFDRYFFTIFIENCLWFLIGTFSLRIFIENCRSLTLIMLIGVNSLGLKGM